MKNNDDENENEYDVIVEKKIKNYFLKLKNNIFFKNKVE